MIIFFSLLFLISLFSFFPFQGQGFVLDAHYVIAQNPLIKQPQLFSEIFSTTMFQAHNDSAELSLGYYRPIVVLSFALDYFMWGLNVWGMRLSNVVIHFLNASLFFGLVNYLFKNKRLAMIAAIIFCILPVHEWVVRYSVGRGDLLQWFFSLSSLWLIVWYESSKKVVGLIGAVCFFVLAILSREVSVLLPLFVFACIYIQSNNFKRAFQLSFVFALISFTYFIWRQQWLPITQVEPLNQSFVSWLIFQFKEILSMNMHWLLPWSLFYFVYEYIGFVYLFASILIGSLLLYVYSNRRENSKKIVLFAVVWILCSNLVFLPTTQLMQRLGPYLCEHFLYGGSFGFALLLAAVLTSIRNPRLIMTSLVMICGIYYVINFDTMKNWESEKKLLSSVVKTEPSPFTVSHRQLLMRYDDNVNQIVELINFEPSTIKKSLWFKRLGSIHRQKGELEKAKIYLAQALQLNENNVAALNEMGVIYLEEQKDQIGLNFLKESQKKSPQNNETTRLLGTYHYRQKNWSQAQEYLKKAVFINPEDEQSQMLLAMTYYFQKQVPAFQEHISGIVTHVDNQFMVEFITHELQAHGFEQAATQIWMDWQKGSNQLKI